jgi:hypothetical protein
MLELSSHTHQINIWIALTKFQPTFSNTLAELRFECDIIEDQLYLLDMKGNETIAPDVVLSSDKLDHSLVVDCKSETIDRDQLRRYLNLRGNEEQLIIQDMVKNVEGNELTIDLVLSSFSDLTTNEIHENFMIIHFDADPHSGLAIWCPDPYLSINKSVNNAFPINVHPGEPLPTGHYPYDVFEADKEAMVSNVLATILSLSIKEVNFPRKRSWNTHIHIGIYWAIGNKIN